MNGICRCCGISLSAMAADGWRHNEHELREDDPREMQRHSFDQEISLSGLRFHVELSAVSHPTIDQKYFAGSACFSFRARCLNPPAGVSAPDVEGGYGSIATCMTLLLMPGGTRLDLPAWQRPDESRLERYARVLNQQRR